MGLVVVWPEPDVKALHGDVPDGFCQATGDGLHRDVIVPVMPERFGTGGFQGWSAKDKAPPGEVRIRHTFGFRALPHMIPEI